MRCIDLRSHAPRYALLWVCVSMIHWVLLIYFSASKGCFVIARRLYDRNQQPSLSLFLGTVAPV